VSDYRAAIAPPDETPDAARPAQDLVLVTTPAMRARRHPWAIVGVWAWQAALALVASWPAGSLARAAYGGDPRGDAVLWDAGGHALLDALWHDSHGVSVVMRAGGFALAAGIVVGLVPAAALMFAMAYATRERGRAGAARSLAAAVGAFGAFAVLLVAFGVLQGIVVGAGAGVARWAEHMAHPSMGEAHAELLEGAVGLLFVVGASVLGVVHDMARAAVVRFQVSGLRGFALGARAFRSAPVRLWWSWAWRTGAAAAPVAAAAAAASAMGGRGGAALALLALLHQAVVASRIALRASWLGVPLRTVDVALARPSA